MSNFYLDKFGFIPPQIGSKPSDNLGLIVVIPCYNEPNIYPTLNAVKNCASPTQDVEVIFVVNSSEDDPEYVKNQNLKTIQDFSDWRKLYEGKINFLLIHEPNLPKKHAGVGLARKIGMDEAVARFHTIEKDGIIVCFDADSKCSPNYLTEIEKHFERNTKSPGCSIHFEHPLDGTEYSSDIYAGIVNYELHLRYYNQCFRFCDLPYAFHTVGSSMAVRSSAYQKQGGMNRRKAGEDFYFLHKIISLGGFTEIKSATVIPSPRTSDRVPFGTGKAIGDWLMRDEQDFYTYNFNIFKEIKLIVTLIPDFYHRSFDQVKSKLHPAFSEYLTDLGMTKKLEELKLNTKDFDSFKKRFFAWFDAFQVLKTVHFMQKCGFNDVKLIKAVNQLIVESLEEGSIDRLKNQLDFLRELEKK